MLPIITRHIPSSDYGFYDTSITVVTLFTMIVFLEIGIGTMKYMLEKKSEYSKQQLISNSMYIFMFSASLYLIVGIIASVVYSVDFFWLIFLYGFIDSILRYFGFLSRGQGKNKVFAIGGIIQALFINLISIVLIIIFEFDYSALYWSFVFSGLITLIYYESKLDIFRNIRFNHFDIKVFTKLIMFCLPLGINSAAFWLLNSSNSLIITLFLGSEFTGFYSVSNKFSQVIILVSTAFQFSWQDITFSKINNDYNALRVFYSKTTNGQFVLFSIALILSIPAIRILLFIWPSFIDSSYSEAINLIPIALTAAMFSIMSSFVGSVFISLGMNKQVFLTTIVGALINVIVTISLIHMGIGVLSASIGLALGFFFTVFSRIFVLKRKIGLTFDYVNIITLFVFLGIAIFVYMNHILVNLMFLIIVILITILKYRKLIFLTINKLKGEN
jgi:O-antigen/teichoic acid export membrane protein